MALSFADVQLMYTEKKEKEDTNPLHVFCDNVSTIYAHTNIVEQSFPT